jgi:MFS transporter, MHS family, proline/betaine transporter
LTDARQHGASMKAPTKLWQVVATCIGNALEWYDFTIYGYLAATIAKLFFPPGNETAALLSTYAVFGLAYVVRPIGGLALAHYADIFGRKSVLFAVIALMTLGVGMIALTPTYATIGILATIIVVTARLIQGLSAGGEFGSSMSYLIEQAPPHLRGLYGGWQQAGQGAAALLAGLVGVIVAGALSPEQLESWGWRLPFLLGLIIGPVGAYMRAKLQETSEFLAYQTSLRGRPIVPLGRVLAEHKKHVLISFGLVLGGAATVYILFVFMPTYAIRTLRLGQQDAFLAPLAAGAMLTLLCPVAGYLSDRWTRRSVMLISAALFLIALYPAFVWLNSQPSVGRLVTVELVFGVLMAGYAGPFGAALGDLFPVGVRVTGMSLAYNLGVAVFGGFAPLIVTWLIVATGSPLAPAYYVMAGLALSLIATIALPRSSSDGLSPATA